MTSDANAVKLDPEIGRVPTPPPPVTTYAVPACGFMSSVSKMGPSRFDVKISDDYDDQLMSSVDSLSIRLNGDLRDTLRRLHEISDDALDAVCRKALTETNILIQSGPG